MIAAQKKQRPLIRYAGSAAETSIDSKPIGSELNAKLYPDQLVCQAKAALAQTRTYLSGLRQTAEPKARNTALTPCPNEIVDLVHPGYQGQSNAPNTLRRAVKGTTNEQNRWPR